MYENWKSTDDRYKNRTSKSGPTQNPHYRTEEGNHNKQTSANLNRRHSQCLSPPSPINQSSSNPNDEALFKECRERQRLNSLKRQKQIQLPMDLPLPEFALNLKLNKQTALNEPVTHYQSASNKLDINKECKEITSQLKEITKEETIRSTKSLIDSSNLNSNSISNSGLLNANSTTSSNVLLPLTIKCDEKTQNKMDSNKDSSSSIMSPLNNTLTSPISNLRAQQQRNKSESVSSDNNSIENSSLRKSESECLVTSPEHSPKSKNKSTINSIDERIRALDNKFSFWSNNSLSSSSTNNSNNKLFTSSSNSSIPSTPTDLLNTPITPSNSTMPSNSNQQQQPTTPVIDYSKYNIKKKSSSISSASNSNNPNRTEPSDIVKSLLSKTSIFDQGNYYILIFIYSILSIIMNHFLMLFFNFH